MVGLGKHESELDLTDRVKYILHLLRVTENGVVFSTKARHCFVIFCLTLRYACSLGMVGEQVACYHILRPLKFREPGSCSPVLIKPRCVP